MGMTTPTGYAVYLLGQLAINCIVFIALCDICKRYFRLDELLSFCGGAFLLGALGYLAFWIAYANYAVFGVVRVVLLAGVVIYFASVAYRHTLRVYGWLAGRACAGRVIFLSHRDVFWALGWRAAQSARGGRGAFQPCFA